MKKQKCDNCGYRVRNYMNFCPNCGEHIIQESEIIIDSNSTTYIQLKNNKENIVHLNLCWLVANIFIWPLTIAIFYYLISTGFFDRITMFITNTY